MGIRKKKQLKLRNRRSKSQRLYLLPTDSFRVSNTMGQGVMERGAYDENDIAKVLRQLVDAGTFDMTTDRGEGLCIVYDMDSIRKRSEELHYAFNVNGRSNFLHCFAVKDAPVVPILQACLKAGMGLECASIVEVQLSLRSGCPSDRVVFDGVAKTVHEIEFALQNGVHLNMNSFAEVGRVQALLTAKPELAASTSRIGLRVNPLIGKGSIAMFSVSTSDSKFGVPITEREQIIECFGAHPWINGLHVHVGSQGFQLDSMVEGIACVVDLVPAVEEKTSKKLKFIDIGGGLPGNYDSRVIKPTYLEYSQLLQKRIPLLFDPSRDW